MEVMTTIGTAVACGGLLFFLFCAGLLFWYLFNQPKQTVSTEAPVPAVQASVEHSSASTPSPSAPDAPVVSNETPRIDG